jgi:hypothetical protein
MAVLLPLMEPAGSTFLTTYSNLIQPIEEVLFHTFALLQVKCSSAVRWTSRNTICSNRIPQDWKVEQPTSKITIFLRVMQHRSTSWTGLPSIRYGPLPRRAAGSNSCGIMITSSHTRAHLILVPRKGKLSAPSITSLTSTSFTPRPVSQESRSASWSSLRTSKIAG